MNSEKRYILTLLLCTLENKTPPEKPDNVSFESIYNISMFHKIANLVYYSIEKLIKKPDSTLISKWSEARDKCIIRDIIQQNEYDCVCKAASEAHIRILPIKGFWVKNVYPQSDMRFMSDIDILVDSENRSRMKKVMESCGYIVHEYGKCNHDTYFKEPLMNIEIHGELFQSFRSDFNKYYRNAWSNALEIKPYVYEFIIEDMFIYIMAHTAKHYLGGGTGIRSVVDFYLILKKYESSMNMFYVKTELKKIGIDCLFETFRNVSAVWFEGKDENEQSERFTDYIFSSGIYGTKQNKINNEIGDDSKIRYVLKRMFPGMKFMCDYCPLLNKLPFLLIIAWLYRLIISALTKTSKIINEIKCVLRS